MHALIQPMSLRHLRMSAQAVPPMPICRRRSRRRLRSHLIFHLLLSTDSPALRTLPRRNELAHAGVTPRRTRGASASFRSPRETRSLIPQSSFRICPKGLRFVTVPLSLVTCHDLSYSSPVFIHMHSTLRLTRYMHILLSHCLCSLFFCLLFSLALS